MFYHQDNAPCHKLLATMVKLNELGFELFPPPSVFRSGPSDNWLFADLKKMLHGRRFGSNEEVIAKTEAYFEAEYTLFYKKKALKRKYVVK